MPGTKRHRRPTKTGPDKAQQVANKLERLRDDEEDVLRFMENADVPFTNNQGEHDIFMTKVQQKISGFFRSMERGRKESSLFINLLAMQK